MILIFLFQILKFLCIHAFDADIAAINPNRIKTLLPNEWSTFFINDKTVFRNGPRSLPRIPPDCIDWDGQILADELFGKSLQRLTTSLLVDNNNLCGKPSPH